MDRSVKIYVISVFPPPTLGFWNYLAHFIMSKRLFLRLSRSFWVVFYAIGIFSVFLISRNEKNCIKIILITINSQSNATPNFDKMVKWIDSQYQMLSDPSPDRVLNVGKSIWICISLIFSLLSKLLFFSLQHHHLKESLYPPPLLGAKEKKLCSVHFHQVHHFLLCLLFLIALNLSEFWKKNEVIMIIKSLKN